MNSKMNPEFSTDIVYGGNYVYHYPKDDTEPKFWRETQWATGNLYGKGRLLDSDCSLKVPIRFIIADDEANLL